MLTFVFINVRLSYSVYFMCTQVLTFVLILVFILHALFVLHETFT